jgi:hypothetical protein
MHRQAALMPGLPQGQESMQPNRHGLRVSLLGIRSRLRSPVPAGVADGAGNGGRLELPPVADAGCRGVMPSVSPFAASEDDRARNGRDLRPDPTERRMQHARTDVPVWTGLRIMVEDLAVDVDVDVDLADAALNLSAAS